MSELSRILPLFEGLYNGENWIDVTISETLGEVTAKQAASKISSEHNSIWQIVNHMISWRENVAQRVQGKTLKTPANNYISEIDDVSELAWSKTLQRLEASQQEWVKVLKSLKDEDLVSVYQVTGVDYYGQIHGIMQHDAYHLGQIVLLKKLLS